MTALVPAKQNAPTLKSVEDGLYLELRVGRTNESHPVTTESEAASKAYELYGKQAGDFRTYKVTRVTLSNGEVTEGKPRDYSPGQFTSHHVGYDRAYTKEEIRAELERLKGDPADLSGAFGEAVRTASRYRHDAKEDAKFKMNHFIRNMPDDSVLVIAHDGFRFVHPESKVYSANGTQVWPRPAATEAEPVSAPLAAVL